MPVSLMAHQGASTNASYCSNGDRSTSQLQQLANPIFHDFLGIKTKDNPLFLAPKTADVTLSEASLSPLAPIGASSCGTRGPFSSTSDRGSEDQVGDYLEGVPFHSPRNEISVLENSKMIAAGIKRGNPDFAFMWAYKNQIPHVASDALERSNTMKILQNRAGGDQPRSNDNEVVYCMQPPTIASSSRTQHSLGTRLNANVLKWERPIASNVGPPAQYPPLGSHFVRHVNQIASNRFREFNVGPSSISQSAADEGSSTGMKGPGIFSCITDGHVAKGRHSSHMLPSCGRQKSRTEVLEYKPFDPPSQQGLESSNRQMTIFYSGQAHVFDDVHPNKADVIMALAGSNGGFWSTALSPKSNARPIVQSNTINGEIETGISSEQELAREYPWKSYLNVMSSQGVGNDPISTQAGDHPRSIPSKETREPVHAAEPSTKGKCKQSCSNIVTIHAAPARETREPVRAAEPSTDG